MATVQDLVNRTLKLIAYLPAGETATADESNDTLDALNDMLAQWNDMGIKVSASTLTLATTFPIDKGDQAAVRYNLAAHIWTEFFPNQPLNSNIAVMADDLKRSLFAKYANIPEAEYDRGLTARSSSFNILTDS